MVNNITPIAKAARAVMTPMRYDHDARGELALVRSYGTENESLNSDQSGVTSQEDSQAPLPTMSGIQGKMEVRHRPIFDAVKRAFDVVFSLAILIGFSWLFLVIAILIKLDDPKGPVFFRQVRVTRGGKEFTMVKFRTMCVDAEAQLKHLKHLNEKSGPVFKIENDPRVTGIGRWLRKLGLDELPQFWNVLCGDISTVGPRPALPAEVATYSGHVRQRLLVKGGITCYWQTRRNRDAITFDDWVALDLLYVTKRGPWTDIKIIVQTVGAVLLAQGS